ncbi:MAG: hypothetical protein WCO12_02505 [bacterium]
MDFHKHKLSRGFTFVETLVYIAVFTLISGALIELMFFTQSTFNKINSSEGIESSANIFLESLSRDVHDSASSTIENSQLTLYEKDGSGNIYTVEYSTTTDNMLVMSQNGYTKTMTDPETLVSNLSFTDILTPHSKALGVEVSFKNIKSDEAANNTFWATYILKGSYK